MKVGFENSDDAESVSPSPPPTELPVRERIAPSRKPSSPLKIEESQASGSKHVKVVARAAQLQRLLRQAALSFLSLALTFDFAEVHFAVCELERAKKQTLNAALGYTSAERYSLRSVAFPRASNTGNEGCPSGRVRDLMAGVTAS